MHWTDQIRNVKIFLVISAIVIAVASLVVSHYLVKDLAMEERAKMGVWAEAMRSLSLADENTDLNLVLKVIDENHTIPVVVTDKQGNVQTFRNIKLEGKTYEDSLKVATDRAQEMLASGR